MARSSVFDLQAVADPAQQWNFDFFLPAIPGSSDTKQLTWRCMTTAMPGSQVGRVSAALHGVRLDYMGMREYSHTFNSTLMEAVDWQTRASMFAWMDAGRNWITNTGNFASVYKVTGQTVVYNDLPQVVRTCNVYGLWPEQIQDIELDGGQQNLISLNVTWAYDFWIDV